MSFCSVSGLARAATISGHATRSQGPADGPDEFLFFCLCDLCVCGCHMVSLIFALPGREWWKWLRRELECDGTFVSLISLKAQNIWDPKIQDHWTARMESIDVNRTYWSYCAILCHVCVRLADATVINSQVCFPVTVFRIRLNSKQGKGSDQPFLWESLLMLRARARARVASCYHVVSCCIQSIQK
jgi:hypothetical protein